MEEIKVIFFDLGDTLGTAIVEHGVLSKFIPFDFAIPVLRNLKTKGMRLGVISNTGNETRAHMDEVLKTAKLLKYFEPSLLIFSSEVDRTKNSPAIFKYVVEREGLDPRHCLFTGENPEERNYAHQAKLEVCPHPLLIAEKLAGQALRYVRVEPGHGTREAWIASLRAQNEPPQKTWASLLPLHLNAAEPGSLFAMASERVLANWEPFALGAIKTIGDAEPAEETDLYLVETSLPAAGDPRLRRVLDAVGDRLLIAAPNAGVLEQYHATTPGHGDTQRLMAQPMLLEPRAPHPPEPAFFAVSASRAESTLPLAELHAWEELTAAQMLQRVERYSGQARLEAGNPLRIKSRHTTRAGNLQAVEALEREFASIGGGRLTVRRHAFTHQGRTLFNVIAELAGDTEELILISAHLDSTSENPSVAPGADDDASGMAAVLSIAERFLALTAARRARRTAQFVLFNDEENGLVGSQAYARFLRDANAVIAGVFQMDMIGYNAREPKDWELHIGVALGSAVEQQSRALAESIAAAAELVAASLPAPQVYDSSTGDPAAGRSDHGPFHALGYAACLVSEDFFGGPGGSSQDANPHYHKTTDRLIDPVYAALIARATGAAAWAWLSGQTLPRASRALTEAKRRIDRVRPVWNNPDTSHNSTLERKYTMATHKKDSASKAETAASADPFAIASADSAPAQPEPEVTPHPKGGHRLRSVSTRPMDSFRCGERMCFSNGGSVKARWHPARIATPLRRKPGSCSARPW